MQPKRIRWTPRFSVRCLLLSILVVAVPCTYFGLPVATYYREATAVEQLASLGGSFRRRVFYSNGGIGLRAATWWGNEKFFGRVVHVNLSSQPITDDDILVLSHLKDLRSVNLSNTNVTDKSVQLLSQLPRINSVDLSGTKVSDASADSLQKMAELHFLNVSRTLVTDASLDSISQMVNLTRLKTNETAITLSAIIRKLSTEIARENIMDRYREIGYAGGRGNANWPDHWLLWLDSDAKARHAIGILESMEHYRDLAISLGFTPEIATDELVGRVADIPIIVALHVDSSRVTDAGINRLACAQHLRYLAVYKAPISEACVSHLLELRNLEVLVLPTSATPTNIESLRKRMSHPQTLVFGDSGVPTRDTFWEATESVIGEQRVQH